MERQRCISAWSCFSAMLLVSGVRGDEIPDARGAKPPSPAEITKLDARMKEVSESFVRDTTMLVSSYEKIGQYDRAKMLLEALRKLNPGNDAVKEKLADLDKRILDQDEFEVDIDTDRAWATMGMVHKGQMVRIKITGEYRFSASATVGANGVADDNPAEDLVTGIPLGAVMGAIASATATPSARPAARPPKPFLVGSEFLRPAEEDGVLYLKVNVPPGSKCTGQLKARISGIKKM